jgi:predicted O-methyltransferase YrrM
MRFKIFIMLFCVTAIQIAATFSLVADSADNILKGRMTSANIRYETFSYALKLMKQRNVKTIVETGTTRGVNLKDIFSGDGGSTILFADWASKNGAFFYSVDIDANSFANSTQFLLPYKQYVKLVVSDSVNFLQNFHEKIDMLYLDSYDFQADNPNPSQEHHLKEIIAAMPNLTDNSIILIDDCGLPHGGKGTLAIQYLQNLGWKVVLKGYQVLLLKQ